jgi:hypothetical protein
MFTFTGIARAICIDGKDLFAVWTDGLSLDVSACANILTEGRQVIANVK